MITRWKIAGIILFLTLFLMSGCSDVEDSTMNSIMNPCSEENESTSRSRSSGGAVFCYPIVPGTSEWAKLESHLDKIEVCSIPQEILDTISTDNLVEVCLEYPLYIDAYAYDDMSTGISALISQFNGLQELMKRKDNAEAIVSKLEDSWLAQTIDLSESKMTSNNARRNLRYNVMLELLNRSEVVANIEDTARLYALKSSLTNEANDLSKAEYTTTKPIYTPLGSKVSITTASASDVDAETLLEEYLEDYPNAVFLTTDIDIDYNCHSYAWYIAEGNTGKYWFDLSKAEDGTKFIPYIYDGSYVVASQTDVTANKLVYFEKNNLLTYDTPTHSAVCSPSSVYVTSKWGKGFLMRHKKEDCPYYTSKTYLKFYKLNMSISGPTAATGSPSSIGNLTYKLIGANPNATVNWGVNSSLIVSGQGTSTLTVYPNYNFSISASHEYNDCYVSVPGFNVTCDIYPVISDIQIFQYGQTGFDYTLKAVIEDFDDVVCEWSCDDPNVVFYDIQYPDDVTFIDGLCWYTSVSFPSQGVYTIGVKAASSENGVYGYSYEKQVSIF